MMDYDFLCARIAVSGILDRVSNTLLCFRLWCGFESKNDSALISVWVEEVAVGPSCFYTLSRYFSRLEAQPLHVIKIRFGESQV